MADRSKFEIVQTGRAGRPNLADELLKAARELPAKDLPELIGQLETIKTVAWARLAAPASKPHDELLSVPEAAHRLGISKDYLYAHHQEYPFTRRVGRKLLFSALGIEKHICQNET